MLRKILNERRELRVRAARFELYYHGWERQHRATGKSYWEGFKDAKKNNSQIPVDE